MKYFMKIQISFNTFVHVFDFKKYKTTKLYNR